MAPKSTFVKFKKVALKGSGRELLKKKGGPVSNPSEVESTGCAQPEENLCPTLLLLDEERFPLTIVSTRRTNGKSCYYERVARLDAPHSRLTCWCCRHHSSVGGDLQQTMMMLMLLLMPLVAGDICTIRQIKEIF